jgi:hypothetical protein
MFQIIVAYGIVQFYFMLKKHRKIYANILASVVILFLIYFIHIYFVQYPWRHSGDWQYGYKESIYYVKSVEQDYERVVVTNSLGRPYIYYLFYLKTHPEVFQKSAKIERDPFGFVAVEKYSNYFFPKAIEIYKYPKKTLFITSSEEKLPPGATHLKTFNKTDGKPVLQAFTL